MSFLRSLALLSLLVAPAAFAHNGDIQDGQIVRFKLTDSIIRYLRTHELDVTGINWNTREVEALLSQEELEQLHGQKAMVSFSFPQSLLAAPDDRYKNPEEIEDLIRDIHSRYPAITEVRSIGKSLEGRDIWAIKISDNAKSDEKEPVVFVNAMHHAREIMTPEITTDMVEYLATNYGSNADVTRWVNETEIWVVPMFNVDGNNKMWDGNSMWRKNTRDGHGVDINRNYPHAWNTCNGSSGSKDAQDFRGNAAASEPETRAMMDFVSDIKPVFSISYHSYSEIVIYPFGCKSQRTPAEEAVEVIGAEIGKAINYKPGTAWELLYSVDGGDIDWYYAVQQVIPYVIEVNSTWDGFHPNYDKARNKTVERNRPGWMTLLNRLNGPSLVGQLKNKAFTTIKLAKAGEAKTFQTYKINPDGSFYIIVKPGSYDVTFEGAETRKMQNVEVQGKQVISL